MSLFPFYYFFFTSHNWLFHFHSTSVDSPLMLSTNHNHEVREDGGSRLGDNNFYFGKNEGSMLFRWRGYELYVCFC